MPPQGKSPLESLFQKADDCDRPACEETVSALSQALSRIGEKTKTTNKKTAVGNGGVPSSSSSSAAAAPPCPVTKDELGKSSWTLLHSMAAWYPEKPTKVEETKMAQLMEAISIFYPCTYCAEDFRESLKENPTKTESRQDLSLWLCGQHNLVNEKLGKPIFKCDVDILDERWRKSSDSRCTGDKDS
eukprot:CAMPEP_0198251068 /NCGR_PEP_ID=MMETSP1447-20131203/2032_1 /TAXON_ID=420782 /ORGANISM="Chaetoceros dichaeta, Strain CCMP1751" /LENGTH=186 /DNA_ID=CAMNT_0043936013 /DNA_START=161 /DNA_END=721 /DNA_ORIENTATION=+